MGVAAKEGRIRGMTSSVRGERAAQCRGMRGGAKAARPSGEMDEAAEMVGLGPVLASWHARRELILGSFFAGPVLGALSLWRFAGPILDLVAGCPTPDPRRFLWGIGLLLGVVATLTLAALVRLRIHLHERGLVVRTMDGVRAFSWAAVRGVQSRGRGSFGGWIEVLQVALVHGERLRIVGLSELALLRALIEWQIRGGSSSIRGAE